MKASTTLVIDDPVVVTIDEISVDELDGYALSVTTADGNVKLVLAGTYAELSRLVGEMAEAAAQLEAKRGAA